ncbi:plasma membrane localization protein [Sarracenia purpurea var. burkii]
MVVRRACDKGQDELVNLTVEAIAALASHNYYFDQLNDIVGDLIDVIRRVKSGGGEAAGYRPEERARALRCLVEALRDVIKQAGEAEDVVAASSATEADGQWRSTKSSASNRMQRSTSGISIPVPNGDGTIKANGTIKASDFDGGKKANGMARELHASAFDLAISFMSFPASLIGSPVSFARSPASPSKSPKSRSRKSSVSSVRRASLAHEPPPPDLALPNDYAALKEILHCLHETRSPYAVLHGVPMLLSSRSRAQSSRWDQEEKVQACREIGASTLVKVAEVWQIDDVQSVSKNVSLSFLLFL